MSPSVNRLSSLSLMALSRCSLYADLVLPLAMLVSIAEHWSSSYLLLCLFHLLPYCVVHSSVLSSCIVALVSFPFQLPSLITQVYNLVSDPRLIFSFSSFLEHLVLQTKVPPLYSLPKCLHPCQVDWRLQISHLLGLGRNLRCQGLCAF